MNSGIEQFIKQAPNLNTDVREMDTVIAPWGDFRELDGINAIVMSLNRMFLISKNTYLFDPELGCAIYKYLFEPANIVTQSSIEAELQDAISRYETRAKISYDILFFSDQKGFRINLYIEYEGKTQKLTIDIDEQLLKDVP
jgi:phage baseplate assembly protein W